MSSPTLPSTTSLESGPTFVIALHPKHNRIFRLGLLRLQKLMRPEKIIVLTSAANRDFYQPSGRDICPIEIIDEDQFIPGIDRAGVAAFLEKKGANPAKAGWYFQQFLKMAVATRADLGPYYVIWDSDTVLLRPLTLRDEEKRTLLAFTGEFNAPYFETMQRLLGLPRLSESSFISEHMLVETEVMRALLQTIEQRHPESGHWVWTILESIAPEALSGSGFSEFETYGNFLAQQKPDSFRRRNVPSMRYGAAFYGQSPWTCDLLFLARKYHYVSFETWHETQFRRLLVHRLKALAFLPLTWLEDIRRKPEHF